MIVALLWGLTAVLAVADWVAVARGDRRTETWAKPGTLLALLAAAAASGATEQPGGWWLLVALAFGLLGDVMLLGTSERRFQAGLGAFLVGHLAYLVCFLVIGFDAPAWTVAGVLVVAVALTAARRVLPAVHRDAGMALSVPVAVYMGVISAMTLAAWATGVPLIAIGASVFLASDTILAIDRFVAPRSWARPAVMVTYHLGQALIVLGVLLS